MSLKVVSYASRCVTRTAIGWSPDAGGTSTMPSISVIDRLALGDARLEQLLDARQTLGDVLAGDAAGVERPHRELRARLADRLGGDDAHRLAEVDEVAGGQVAAVAHAAHAVARGAGER